MRQLSILVIFCLFAVGVQASAGDTTWVQATNTQFTHYGNFDTTIAFPAPGTSYRKVYMIFTLGKYMCPGYPGSTTWCGDWDYTITNYLLTPGGDTLEIARLISPYANNGAPRTPWTWTQNYVYDVTDYANLMRDSATLRVNYSGYSWGFTGNIKFAFIEGTPDRNVVGIKRLWNGYFTYGDTTHHDSNAINTHFPVLTSVAPTSATYGALKFTVTGHGSDTNYCCEFLANSYNVYHNRAAVDSYLIWRNDCGLNELYPQSGTWLLNRANWCPGALVVPNYHNLPGVGEGATDSVDVQFSPYAVRSASGGYAVEGQMIYYGNFNKTLDASLDQIIAPTIDANHWRENPICGNPIVQIKNTGSGTIDSVAIQYGVTGISSAMYTWVGTLLPLHDTQIALPPLTAFDSLAAPTPYDTTKYNFNVEIVNVNGAPDNDRHNDTLHSQFVNSPVWPNPFRIYFNTNSNPATTGTISETNWYIEDVNNNVVRSRYNNTISHGYLDTIALAPGCYKFILNDTNCDGLHWWAEDGSTGYGAGSLYVRKMTTSMLIAMHGYNYGGSYANDFGCNYTMNFTINSYPTAITAVNEDPAGIVAFPNPARRQLNLLINGLSDISGTVIVYDMLGREVLTTKCNATSSVLDIAGITNGVYTIAFMNETGNGCKLTTRVLIQN